MIKLIQYTQESLVYITNAYPLHKGPLVLSKQDIQPR